jgi:hypothetical protein
MFAAGLFKVFDFVANNRVAQIVLLCFAVIGTLGLYLAWRDNGVRKRVKQEQAVETAREREVVLDTSRKEIDNVEDAKDAAIAAPDSLPEFSSADQLRDEAPAIAEVILRSRRGDQ